jgi:hypothetical protein
MIVHLQSTLLSADTLISAKDLAVLLLLMQNLMSSFNA